MHEVRVLPCIFGCEAVDSLGHYLCCDSLWTAVISHTGSSVELLQSCPATKLGLHGSPVAWMRRVSVAFSCYHAIKLGHRDEVDSAVESGNPYQVHERLMNYARVFSLEEIPFE